MFGGSARSELQVRMGLRGGRCLQKQMYINVLNLAEIFKVRSETRDVVGGGGVVGFAGSPWFRRPRVGVYALTRPYLWGVMVVDVGHTSDMT